MLLLYSTIIQYICTINETQNIIQVILIFLKFSKYELSAVS